MTEIFNLHTLCRCCHSDGSFKSLQLSYSYESRVEVYATMLQETFDVTINPAPFEASYAICDQCILKLREAACFKEQVLECEQKFEVYCKNEQALIVKEEVDFDYDNDLDRDDKNTESQSIDDEKDSKHYEIIVTCPQETKVKDDGTVDEKFSVKIKDEIKEDIPKVNTETVPIEYDPPINKTNEVVHKKTVSKIVKAPPKRRKKRICLDLEFESRIETDGVSIYVCKICDEKFKLLKHLRTHIGSCHQDVYKCQICSIQYHTRVTYQRHIRIHDQDDLNCQYCGKRFKSKNSLSQHVNVHTKDEKFQCDLCQKFFAYKQTLKKHLLWHYGVNKTCMCDICGHVFNDKSNLKSHVQIVHEKQRPFKCQVCSKAFTANKHLKHHSYTHTGEKPYKCEMCFNQFATPWQLKHHQFKRHTDSPESRGNIKFYSCKVCHLKVESRARLMVHLKTHMGQREYKCHLCPKDYTCKYSLDRHISEHSGIKAYSCDLCSKSYTQQSKLSRHKKRIHDPTSDFYRLTEKIKCDICNKSFTDIKKHLKSHSRRPHVCEICSKSYPERNTLNRHVLYVHHGMKPHPCTMCQKKYAKWQALEKHMKRIHKLELKREVKES